LPTDLEATIARDFAVRDYRQRCVVMVYAVWRLRFRGAHICRPFHVAGGRAGISQ
jgi:hypothetical protein